MKTIKLIKEYFLACLQHNNKKTKKKYKKILNKSLKGKKTQAVD